jgi:hypothetical protein
MAAGHSAEQTEALAASAQAGGRHRHPTEPESRAGAGAKLKIIRGIARSSYGAGPAA